jgi:uncharacterized membrane protein YGL010W
MKNIVEQLSTYKSVHLNKKNIRTHFVGVPLIVWSVFVLISLVQLPIAMENGFTLTLAIPFTLVIMVYYFWLNYSLALALLLYILPTAYSAHWVALMPDAHWIALAIFVVGWIIQFIGHHFEKAKPAFADDINQLLIGPLFLMAEIFFMLGLLKPLEDQITPLAVQKRRSMEQAS